MKPALEKLDKMLSLEIEAKYQNKAVIGGLEQVLSWWPMQARQECGRPEQKAWVDEVIALLQGYGALQDRQARVQAVAEMREKLAQIDAAGQSAASEREPALDVPAPVQDTPSAPPSYAPAEQDSRRGLNSPVTVISGIGPAQAKRLERLGIRVIDDMLYFFPHRYDDYSQLKSISRLEYGEQATVIGTIRSTRVKHTRGGATIINTIVADGSGAIQATWFNQPYLAQQFKRGRQIVLSGKVDEYLGRTVMSSPAWEPLESDFVHTGRLVPIYPLTQGLHARWLRKIMRRTVDYWTKRLPDHLPNRMRERLDLMPLEEAVAQMHFPDDAETLARARRRLAFDEFLTLQLGVLRQRQRWQREPGIPVPTPQARLDAFLAGLPYTLTGAQQQAMDSILHDMADPRPMSRLLQGDVGSGKTVVAAAALLVAAAAGHQAALMAPTEILAEQHFKNLSQMLGPHDVCVRLLTGSVPQSEKDEIYAGLEAGEIQLAIGTHALIQEGVQFKSLALVVVDEQHRFGVRQRGILRGKGYNPHMLVMSATPIPRTLALTAYGDLDLAVIDEMPPGRQPIRTRWFLPAERERAYRFVRAQVQEGRQAYIICPLVEESDSIIAKAAVQEYERLQKSVFPDLRLGLLHGRLKSEEKEQVMRAFDRHEIDILVSTSVVEVGIDVSNATVMMIEGANRFGLSQLHQFRGRVGRGEHQSYCILLSDVITDVSEERLRAIEETNDGFALAEKDLEMRGPGDFFGTRQSGLPELKLASLGDTPLLELARHEALEIFEVDPYLKHPDHRLLARKVRRFWSGQGDLS
jgi:ATP-dependent DNA helicase RecG